MSIDLPFVSVIIPTFNQARYLPTCLDAVWFQDYPLIEIIVVNAASTDETAQALLDFQRGLAEDEVSFASYYDELTDSIRRTIHLRYPSSGRVLKVITLESDPGLTETYNLGLRQASGGLITTICSDDIPHPTMISTLAHTIQEGADFAYSDIQIVNDIGRIIRVFEYPDFSFQECLANWYLLGSSKLWRKSLLFQSGFFDPTYDCAQDYDLFLRFAQCGARFQHVPKVLYSYRWHGDDHPTGAPLAGIELPNQESRRSGNHTDSRYQQTMNESKKIALRARQWLADGGAPKV